MLLIQSTGTEGSAGTNTALAVSLSSTGWSMLWAWPRGPEYSPPVVVTATGGTGSYSYSWQRISGDPSSYALNPTGSSTGFNNYIPVVAPGRTSPTGDALSSTAAEPSP